MSKPLFKVRGIRKSFRGTIALNDVSLSAYAGEVHALMGENGAGKSTLIKVMTGFYSKDAGEIFLNDRSISPVSNHEAQGLGISTVYQEVNLVPSLSVAENIFLGREPTKWGRIDWKAVREGARKALARLDVDIDVDLALEEYPVAIQQLTAIARALDMSAQVLILDEATSSLDADEVARFFSVLKKLKAEGLAIIFVTHFLDQVYAISDRVTVLRNGKFVIEKKISEITRSELVAQMMGHELQALERESHSDESTRQGDIWLKCQGLGRAGSMQPFELDIRYGETIGIAGLLGSGRTEIARLLFGLDTATSGSIEFDGKSHHFKNPREAMKEGFALCPEDRKAQSIFPGLSVRTNLVLALQARRGWFAKLSPKKQDELTEHYMKVLSIRAKHADQPIETLSGGNQQKVILGRWLALDPRLLIMDEPTRGIDVGAKAEIQKYILSLPRDKKSIVFISSELEEVVRVCERVAILRDRKKVSELKHSDISEDSIIAAIGDAL